MLTFALDPYDNRTHIDETQSRLDYFCPYCGAPLITKKGEVRRHHFSHKSGCACTDSWDREYDMSDWHFLWQARFPKTNKEIRLSLGKTCHRADVVIGRTVIEFQKSPLRQQSFNDRNVFYHDLGYKVVWLFDLREPFDAGQIREDAGESGVFVWDNPKRAFNAYDLDAGNIDLFFQLKDEGPGCIVKVGRASLSGFESFEVVAVYDTDSFLGYVGLKDGVCAAPVANPSETSRPRPRPCARASRSCTGSAGNG